MIGQYSFDTDFLWDLSVSGEVAGAGYLNSLGQGFMVSQPTATGHEPLLPAHNSEPVISTYWKQPTLLSGMQRYISLENVVVWE